MAAVQPSMAAEIHARRTTILVFTVEFYSEGVIVLQAGCLEQCKNQEEPPDPRAPAALIQRLGRESVDIFALGQPVVKALDIGLLRLRSTLHGDRHALGGVLEFSEC